MPIKYVKIYKDDAWQKVESDRLQRFLELGWSEKQPAPEKKSPAKASKNKITADAQVTSKQSDEEAISIDETEVEEDWTQDFDDELPKEED